MGFIENMLRRFSPKPAPARRDYNAAMLSRLTASWTTSNLSANADIYRNLDVLRARSRDLAQNNTYAKKFLSMVGANVVGPAGFTLQARVYDTPETPDQGANDAIEGAFARWSQRGVCEISGQYSFRDLCRLLATTAARDGEFIVRLVRGKSAANGFGIALQVIDIDRLDTKFNETAKSGNDVRMGVEIDAWGRAVAYWLKTAHPGEMWLADGQRGSERIRVPAADILHRFVVDRPEQLRGVPWMHAAMPEMNNLQGYTEAAIIASRVGASKMGFFTSPDGNLAPLSDGQDENGVPYTDADPGTFGTLPAGYDFKPFDPDYPSAMFGDFTKACLRGIASGLDVAYNALANDLEGVNYSSIRQGALSERDSWMQRQAWFIDAFLEPVFAEWLKSALAFGQITLANGSPLPLDKLSKFSAHQWQGRRWQWVDPLKDIEAARLQVQSGIASPQMIAAQNGVDVEDVLADIARFEAMVGKAKVETVSYVPKSAAPVPAEKTPTVQAAKLHADAVVRAAELANEARAAQAPAPQPIINVDARHTTEAVQVRNEIAVPQQAAPVVEVRNEIHEREQAAPTVEVHVEAIMPEQAAPVVNIEVEAAMPERMEMAITEMPERVTTSQIVRDGNGNIKNSVQTEKDA